MVLIRIIEIVLAAFGFILALVYESKMFKAYRNCFPIKDIVFNGQLAIILLIVTYGLLTVIK